MSVFSAFLLLGLALTLVSREPQTDPRLKKASRAAEHAGWIQVHLEGTPGEIGFQHGYLLWAEIQDNFHTISTEMAHDEKKDWAFFRKTAEETLWPHVEQEYRDEMLGIVEGQKARGGKLDIWDVVALNAWLELPYYDKWLEKSKPGITISGNVADHCSAFAATGKYTRDGRIVIGHNNWTSYSSGERWNIMFDIVPAAGNRILMDGEPGDGWGTWPYAARTAGAVRVQSGPSFVSQHFGPAVSALGALVIAIFIVVYAVAGPVVFIAPCLLIVLTGVVALVAVRNTDVTGRRHPPVRRR